MKEFLEKISSYNLFNNLLPGILFVLIAKNATIYDFVQSDILLGLFLYYFIGLIISRIGSFVVEPFLKRCKFVRYAPYKDFVEAEKKDEKINILLETNNMYRSFCAMVVLLLLLKLYECFDINFQIADTITYWILLITILLLFLFSYRKQTAYIKKRIEHQNDKG